MYGTYNTFEEIFLIKEWSDCNKLERRYIIIFYVTFLSILVILYACYFRPKNAVQQIKSNNVKLKGIPATSTEHHTIDNIKVNKSKYLSCLEMQKKQKQKQMQKQMKSEQYKV